MKYDPLLKTWTSVKSKFPPLGVYLSVCRIRGDGQEIWGQTFQSCAEVVESGITHWAFSKFKPNAKR